MKTTTKIFSGLAVLVLALASIGSVSADTIDFSSFGGGLGRGADEENDGLLADYMEAAIAEGLGLTVAELNALEADGSAHYEIALDLGFSAEEFEAIMDDAQERALALAEADGITLQPFGMKGSGNGGFGGGLNEDGQQNFRNRMDGESRGGFGGRMADAEDCDGGICSETPSGMGYGRGLDNEDGFGFGRGMLNEDCDGETCIAEPAGTGIGRGGRR